MKSPVKLILAVMFVLFPTYASYAEKAKEIEWENLVPEGSTLTSVDKIAEWSMMEEKRLSEITPLEEENKEPAPLVSKYNGMQVKIAGYMVPLDFEATSVKKFLLVPYIGACIHVPPPPGNQIILIESEKGVPVIDMYTPIYATGKISTGQYSVEVAQEIGYHMKLDKVTEYQ